MSCLAACQALLCLVQPCFAVALLAGCCLPSVSTAVARDSGLSSADQGLLGAGFPQTPHVCWICLPVLHREGHGTCFASHFSDCAVDRRDFGVSDLVEYKGLRC